VTSGRHALPAAIGVGTIVADAVSKQLAVAYLSPMHVPHEIIGPWVRFTLAYNRGAAFGIHVGEWSRVVFSVIACVILFVLWQLYREATAGERLKRVALALVAGGAVGNLIDRIRWSAGVVDFIDVGTPGWRFWTFNIADSAVTVGTVLLLWTMRDASPASPRATAPAAPAARPADEPTP
jgi:signal peptidase II